MPAGNRRTQEEIVRKGQELYEREIRARVESQHHGRILAIDSETGDYEIADELLDAVRGLRQRCPGAVAYILRIGYPAVYTMGARFRMTSA
jgi:hypothetical protein